MPALPVGGVVRILQSTIHRFMIRKPLRLRIPSRNAFIFLRGKR